MRGAVLISGGLGWQRQRGAWGVALSYIPLRIEGARGLLIMVAVTKAKRIGLGWDCPRIPPRQSHTSLPMRAPQRVLYIPIHARHLASWVDSGLACSDGAVFLQFCGWGALAPLRSCTRAARKFSSSQGERQGSPSEAADCPTSETADPTWEFSSLASQPSPIPPILTSVRCLTSLSWLIEADAISTAQLTPYSVYKRPIGNCWLYGSSRRGLYNHLDKDEMPQIWTVSSSSFFGMWRGSSRCPNSERTVQGTGESDFRLQMTRWPLKVLPRMQGWALGVSPHNDDLVHHSTWFSMSITSLFLLVSKTMRPCFLDLAVATWSLRIRIGVWFQWLKVRFWLVKTKLSVTRGGLVWKNIHVTHRSTIAWTGQGPVLPTTYLIPHPI
jgi:hypothetical protein